MSCKKFNITQKEYEHYKKVLASLRDMVKVQFPKFKYCKIFTEKQCNGARTKFWLSHGPINKAVKLLNGLSSGGYKIKASAHSYTYSYLCNQYRSNPDLVIHITKNKSK